MEIEKYQEEAVRIKNLYSILENKNSGRSWSNEEIFIGLTSDIGDLSRLILAKEGAIKMENIEEKLEHEISDCLWALLVLAKNYNIDLEKAFFENMKVLEKRIDDEMTK
jgi:NTP pyrophosphatase (non-canonical NTP hydrolase)